MGTILQIGVAPLAAGALGALVLRESISRDPNKTYLNLSEIPKSTAWEIYGRINLEINGERAPEIENHDEKSDTSSFPILTFDFGSWIFSVFHVRKISDQCSASPCRWSFLGKGSWCITGF